MKTSLKSLIVFLFLSASQVSADEWKNGILSKIEVAQSMGCEFYPEIDELQVLFSCESAISDVSNAINSGWLKSANKLERLNYLFSLWQANYEGKHVLDLPYVKLAIIRILGQGIRNGWNSEASADMRYYAIKHINSGNVFTQVNAISALGWVGEYKDSELLIEIIREEKEGLSEHAVSALGNLNYPELYQDLSKLLEEITRDDLKTRVKTELQRFG